MAAAWQSLMMNFMQDPWPWRGRHGDNEQRRKCQSEAGAAEESQSSHVGSLQMCLGNTGAHGAGHVASREAGAWKKLR